MMFTVHFLTFKELSCVMLYGGENTRQCGLLIWYLDSASYLCYTFDLSFLKKEEQYSFKTANYEISEKESKRPHKIFRNTNVTNHLVYFKGALSRQFCYILVKTAQIFDKDAVF